DPASASMELQTLGLPAEGLPVGTGAVPNATQVQVLRLAMEADRLESQGLRTQSILDTLQTLGEFPKELLAALGRARRDHTQALEGGEIAVAALELGMILDEDLVTGREVLIAPRGCEVTPSFLEHIQHFLQQLPKPTVAVFRRSGLPVEDPNLRTA